MDQKTLRPRQRTCTILKRNTAQGNRESRECAKRSLVATRAATPTRFPRKNDGIQKNRRLRTRHARSPRLRTPQPHSRQNLEFHQRARSKETDIPFRKEPRATRVGAGHQQTGVQPGLVENDARFGLTDQVPNPAQRRILWLGRGRLNHRMVEHLRHTGDQLTERPTGDVR